MSDHILRIVANDPLFVPSDKVAGLVTSTLTDIVGSWDDYVPHAPEDVAGVRHDSPVYFSSDPLEPIRCPRCRHCVDPDWFSRAVRTLDVSDETTELQLACPRCGAPSSVAALAATAHGAVATYTFDVWHPMDILSPTQLGVVADVARVHLHQFVERLYTPGPRAAGKIGFKRSAPVPMTGA